MAVASPRPYGAFRFDVSIARRRIECSAVVLPRLVIGDAGPVPDGVSPHLVVRRGYTGTLDLYEWWDAERSTRPPRGRRVVVDLLDEAGRPVTRWQFDGCRPIALDYSELDASRSAIVTESITLSVGSVSVS